MKRLPSVPGTATEAGPLGACGGGRVAVRAETTGAGTGGAVALQDQEIRLVPFDRDVVFESLAATFPEIELEGLCRAQTGYTERAA